MPASPSGLTGALACQQQARARGRHSASSGALEEGAASGPHRESRRCTSAAGQPQCGTVSSAMQGEWGPTQGLEKRRLCSDGRKDGAQEIGILAIQQAGATRGMPQPCRHSCELGSSLVPGQEQPCGTCLWNGADAAAAAGCRSDESFAEIDARPSRNGSGGHPLRTRTGRRWQWRGQLDDALLPVSSPHLAAEPPESGSQTPHSP